MAWPKARENWFTPGRTGASTPPGKRCGRRRPFETSDVYSYLENAKTYILFKQPGQPAVKITEAECLAAPGCWTIAKARGQTNGTSAPKAASAPLSGAAVAVSSGTSAMGIEFRFENRQGSPMIVGTGGRARPVTWACIAWKRCRHR